MAQRSMPKSGRPLVKISGQTEMERILNPFPGNLKIRCHAFFPASIFPSCSSSSFPVPCAVPCRTPHTPSLRYPASPVRDPRPVSSICRRHGTRARLEKHSRPDGRSGDVPSVRYGSCFLLSIRDPGSFAHRFDLFQEALRMNRLFKKSTKIERQQM